MGFGGKLRVEVLGFRSFRVFAWSAYTVYWYRNAEWEQLRVQLRLHDAQLLLLAALVL